MSREERVSDTLSKRRLDLIWIVDCSGHGRRKLSTLNRAIPRALDHLCSSDDEAIEIEILVRALAFSHDASWHIAEPTAIADVAWPELVEGHGGCAMGRALEKVAAQLATPALPERMLRPVLALICDSQATDDIVRGLSALEAVPWGRKAVRLAIAFGDADLELARRFVGTDDLPVLYAHDEGELEKHTLWIGTFLADQLRPVRRWPQKPGETRRPATSPLLPPPLPLDHDV